jgi:hypothetical protein
MSPSVKPSVATAKVEHACAEQQIVRLVAVHHDRPEVSERLRPGPIRTHGIGSRRDGEQTKESGSSKMMHVKSDLSEPSR